MDCDVLFRFKKSVTRLSNLMHLRRNHPMEDAIWLLEYVSKTKGAQHLKLSTKNFNMLQYYCIDVIIFLCFLFKITILTYRRCRIVKSEERKRKTD